MLSKFFKISFKTINKSFSKAYGISLLIAILLWALIKFSAIYQSRIEFLIELKQIPNQYILLNSPSKKVTCTLKTSGFRFVLLNYWSTPNLEISFNDLEKNDNDQFSLNLNAYNFKEAPDWLKEAKDVQFELQQLNYTIEELISKKLPIIPDVNLSYRQGYILDHIEKSQDSILVKIPKFDLKPDLNIKTKRIEKQDLHQDNIFKIGYNLPKYWQLSNEKNKNVELSIFIDQLTQGQMVLSIQQDSIRDIKYFPAKVEVNFSVPSKYYNNVSKDDFIVKVNSELIDNELNALKVVIDSKPKQVNILSISPPEVEYLIFDKE